MHDRVLAIEMQKKHLRKKTVQKGQARNELILVDMNSRDKLHV